MTGRRVKKAVPETLSLLGEPIKSAWCRKCMNMMTPGHFHTTNDPYIDTSGLMSICKECTQKIYEEMFEREHNIVAALLRTCRAINLVFDEDVAITVSDYFEKESALKKHSGDTPFARYKTYISKQKRSSVMTFSEPYSVDIKYKGTEIPTEAYLAKFWGRGMTPEQYDFLEDKFAEYQETHKSDTATERSLLRQICFAELDIQEERMHKGSVEKSVKRLQELMKTASVDPAKAALAGGGASLSTFSSIIATIEQMEPADFYKDKELYKDFDNIGQYHERYVTRPIKNFVKESRDFDVGTGDEGDFEEFANNVDFEEAERDGQIQG